MQHKLHNLPKKPGVYLFKNTKDEVLYVGKAKELRSRVRSYFAFVIPASEPESRTRLGSRIQPSPRLRPAGKSGMTSQRNTPLIPPFARGERYVPSPDLDPYKQKMMKEIADIETISTDNETEALVLEANLIREHQPPYNVILRDDKFYLFIKITTSEEFPRVFLTRRLKRDSARYFGPYSSAASVRKTLRLLQRIFPHRGEKESPREHIFPHPLFSHDRAHNDPISPPLHKGRRQADLPLTKGEREGVNNIAIQQYNNNIRNIISFLSGKRTNIIITLRKGMKEAASEKQYERAAIFRDQLQAIERLEGFQSVYLPRKESFDVISIARAKNASAANVFKVRGGKLLDKQTFLLKHRVSAPSRDILRQFLLQYYDIVSQVSGDTPVIPRTIFIPFMLEDHKSLSIWMNPTDPPTIHVPQRGKKRKLLLMGTSNAEQLLREVASDVESTQRMRQAHKELVRAVGFSPQTIHRVETYDVSNIQGQLATASMVVFIDGQIQKSHYKKFRMKFEGIPNDYQMIQETLRRRLAHTDTHWRYPDLIIIDGGKGQLSAAQKVLDEIGATIPVISIAKREEAIFTLERKEALRLPFDSDALYLIQRMRDEAHRFTISYHQLLRSKKQQRSILDEVPGIGPKTKRKLLNYFGSLKAIRAASISDLERVIGKSKASVLKDYI